MSRQTNSSSRNSQNSLITTYNVFLDPTDVYRNEVRNEYVQILDHNEPESILESYKNRGESSIRSSERATILPICNQKFEKPVNINTGIKRFFNKLIRVCNLIKKRDKFEQEELKQIMEKVNATYSKKIDILPQKEIKQQRKDHVHFVMNEFFLNSDNIIYLKEGTLNNISITGTLATDNGGVRRQFFQLAANQLRNIGIFVKTADNTNTYKFNPNSTMDPASLHKLCEFAGMFLAFLLKNGIKINFHLSKSILAALLLREEEYDDDYTALIYILEYPEQGQGLINLMKQIDEISAVDLPDGTDNIESVTTENIREYVQTIGKNNLLSEKTKVMLTHFKKGFYIQKSFLRKHHVSISQLDALLTGTIVSKTQRRIIAEKVRENHQLRLYYTRSQHLIDKINNVIDWFVDIILNDNRFFPKGTISFSKFMKKLCFFWTSSYYFNSEFNYSAIVLTNVANGQLFSAHTCTCQIDIPINFDTKEEMLNILIRSVELAGDDFGFA